MHGTIWPLFPREGQDEEGMEYVQAYMPLNTARTQLEQRQIQFELDLQDDLMTKLLILQNRLIGLANTGQNRFLPEISGVLGRKGKQN